MNLTYLKEGRNYSTADLLKCIKDQVKVRVEAERRNDVDAQPDPSWLTSDFLEGLRESINSEFKKTVVKGTKGSKFVFRYLGLYDYVDRETGKNLTFFFVPKFIDFQEGTDCEYDEDHGDDEDHEDEGADKESSQSDSWTERINRFGEGERNAVLLAIDRYNKEQSRLAEQMEVSEKKRESLLELAVRVLRDYLENGLYTVQRHELERNGQGEIDWNTTIDQFQPVVDRDRPYYMDVMTEQAYSDEEHYITRLHKSLVTAWGSKLEKLGLSSVLRVNVPLLSEEELDHFGDADYQIAQINKELNIQFITKARETLKLMKELIQRSTENQANNYESLSFGMTGVEHLWETACAEVLGTELEKNIRDCGFPDGPEDVTFSKYMPRVFWTNLVPAEDGNRDDSKEFNLDKGSQRSKKAGWRLDFIRTYRPFGRVEKLVILDSKYYCARWNNGSISGQPGTPDIAKQMFYQMAFEDLIQEKKIGFVNAFLLPEDDKNPRYNLGKDIKISETVVLGSRQKGSDKFERAKAFKGINLFAVRIPGIRLLDRYANWEIADDWFEKIVSEAPKGEEENCGGTDAPDAPDVAEKKDGDTKGTKASASSKSNQLLKSKIPLNA